MHIELSPIFSDSPIWAKNWMASLTVISKTSWIDLS